MAGAILWSTCNPVLMTAQPSAMTPPCFLAGSPVGESACQLTVTSGPPLRDPVLSGWSRGRHGRGLVAIMRVRVDFWGDGIPQHPDSLNLDFDHVLWLEKPGW